MYLFSEISLHHIAYNVVMLTTRPQVVKRKKILKKYVFVVLYSMFMNLERCPLKRFTKFVNQKSTNQPQTNNNK